VRADRSPVSYADTQDLLPLPQPADRRQLRPHPAEHLGRSRARAGRGRGEPFKITWHGPDGSGGH
jgi:hypothetical protein